MYKHYRPTQVRIHYSPSSYMPPPPPVAQPAPSPLPLPSMSLYDHHSPSYQRPIPGGPPSSDSLDDDDGGCGPGGPGSWSNWLSSGVPRPGVGRHGIALGTCRPGWDVTNDSHLSDEAGNASTEPQSIGASITAVQPTAGRRNGPL